MEDPTIPLAGAAILALLLGYGGYRVAQRRKAAAAAGADSSLGDSQLAADSFFGASGGQRVDTTTSSSSQMSGQSMQYSPSQLDAGDVDPLAEADVYLAYGRDLQAEEILKEALRTDPGRLVLHQKLAEIYAKRHDRIAFAAVASNLHGLTQGKGPEWQRVADQGLILDPDNALYQPGGQPRAATSQAAVMGGMGAAAASAAGGLAFGDALASVNQTLQQPARANDHEGPPTVPTSMDFNLDLGLPSGLSEAQSPAVAPLPDVATPLPSEQDFAALAQWDAPAPAPAPVAQPTPLADDNSLNLDLDDLASFSLPSAQAPVSAEPAASPSPAGALNSLEFDLDSFTLPETKAEVAAPVADIPVADAEFSLDTDELGTEPMTLQLPIDSGNTQAQAPQQPQAEPTFDLSGLSLDLDTPSADAVIPAAATPSMPEDPMATKLALAEEFNAIGDSDGARTLIEEVIAESHGDLKAKAQALLSQIG